MNRFKNIFVANCSGCSCRVLWTANALSHRMVVAYAGTGCEAVHIGHVNEAIRQSPYSVSEFYLSVDLIIEAAKLSRTEVAHYYAGF